MAVTTSAGLVGKITTPLLRPGVRDAAHRPPLRGRQGRAGTRRRRRRPRRPSRRRPSRAAVGAAGERAGDGAAGTSAADDRAPPEARRRRTTVPGETTTTTTPPTTTTTIAPSSRDTGQFGGQGAESLPQVDLLADTPVFGRFVDGDIVFTSGGSDGLAPPDIPIGVVSNVISRRRRPGPLLEVEPSSTSTACTSSSIVLYRRRRRPATVGHVGGRRLMFASLVQGPLLRLFSSGSSCSPSSARSSTDLRPAGVTLQVMLALAAAAGAAGRTAEGGAGRVRARADVRPGRRHAARLVVDRDGPRRLRRRLRDVDHRPPEVVAGRAVHRPRRRRRRGGGAGDPGVHRRGARVRAALRRRRRRRRRRGRGAEPGARPGRPLVHARQGAGVEGSARRGRPVCAPGTRLCADGS